MIKVTIEVEAHDGHIEIVRDDSNQALGGLNPREKLEEVVGAAEAAALAAMNAESLR